MQKFLEFYDMWNGDMWYEGVQYKTGLVGYMFDSSEFVSYLEVQNSLHEVIPLHNLTSMDPGWRETDNGDGEGWFDPQSGLIKW